MGVSYVSVAQWMLPLCLWMFGFPVHASGMGSYMNLGGLYVGAGTHYSASISTIQDEGADPSVNELAMTADPNFGNIKLKSFEGIGGFAALGYHIGGQFFIEAEFAVYYRDDFLSKKQELDTLVIENLFMSGFVNIGYEMNFGKIRPYVAGGFGAVNRTMDGGYEVTVDKVLDELTPVSLTGGITSAYFEDISILSVGYQLRLGAVIPVGGDQKQGLLIGYRFTGTKDINVKRDDATDLDVDFPTSTATGVGTSDRPITEADADPPFSPTERNFMKKLEYGSHILEIGIQISF